jgi:hypothetical protein
MTLRALSSFLDLKKHNSKGGGISDGGVVCISRSLSSTPIDIEPLPGTALGGFSNNANPAADLPSNLNWCILVTNFDPDTPVEVEARYVFKDGSSAVLNQVPIPANSPDGAGMVAFPLIGSIITHPNKMRFKLVASSGYSLPTRRVLLKACLIEYDKPGDLED